MFLFNKDNIGYILHEPQNNYLIGVDFGDYGISKSIVEKLEKRQNSTLKYIISTHSHHDHCGGNVEWKKYRPDVTIIGGNTPPNFIPGTTENMNDLETRTIGEYCIACMFTPGHTKTHVTYIVTHVCEDSTKIPIIFCGDTLFIGGCGRIFDGTAEELVSSLKKICTLPPDTLVFPGHEYTLKNLEFCLKLDPSNPFIGDKLEWVKKVLSRGDFTVGSRLIDEKLYNPFLKTGEKYYLNLTNEKSEIRAFKKIRLLKDQMS